MKMKKVTLNRNGQTTAKVLNTKKIRSLFNQARRTAARFAERCDFAAAEEIKKAKASCSKDTAYASALYKDRAERVQIITSYTYASGLLGLNFFSSTDEDGTAEDGKRNMIITLSLVTVDGKEFKEGK